MVAPVNINPNLPRKIGAPTLQALDQYDRDFLNRVQAELREHATAINSILPVEGTWTPTISAAVPGDLAVTYTTQIGRYFKRGDFVTVQFEIQTNTFTYTTATGNLLITGLPFTVVPSVTYRGFMSFVSGITSAGYTFFGSGFFSSNGGITITKSGSGVAAASVAITDAPTAGTVRLTGELTYRVVL